MSILEKLEQIQKEMSQNNSPKSKGNANILQNYYSEKLRPGEDSRDDIIRILPLEDKDGNVKVGIGHFHTRLKVGGKWQKLYCAKENDNQECPICDARSMLFSTNDSEDREVAKDYFTTKFYILKVIQRGKEHEGVKFWRFPFSKKGTGVMDKITSLMNNFGDVTDPNKGRDLVLSMKRDTNGYTSLVSVLPKDVSKITDDVTLGKSWLSDTRTFKDVYKPKPKEYLEIVARQETPVWSKDKEMYVSEEQLEEINSEDSETSTQDIINSYTNNKVEETVETTETVENIIPEEVTSEEDTTTTEPVLETGTNTESSDDDTVDDDFPF